MKCLILDPYCGATEEMLLGALLACGADEARVRRAVEGACGAPLAVEARRAGGLIAKAASVGLAAAGEARLGLEEAAEAVDALESRPVQADALDIVRALFDAAEAVYGPGYRLGASTLGLVLGACTAYDALGRPRVFSTPAAAGGGTAGPGGTTALPRPETLRLLEGSLVIVQGGPSDGELLTPGAAAVLAHYVSDSGRYYPDVRPLAVGYGAGAGGTAVLRAVLGEADDALVRDRMELLETNVDDVTGEVLGALIEDLMGAGAMDVSIVPVTMKKGRSGQIVRAIVRAEDGPAIARKIMLETGSLGVRVIPVRHRLIARRDIVTLPVAIDNAVHSLRFKVASDATGAVLDVSVEYDDARRAAREIAMPLRTFMRKAEAEAWKEYEARRPGP